MHLKHCILAGNILLFLRRLCRFMKFFFRDSPPTPSSERTETSRYSWNMTRMWVFRFVLTSPILPRPGNRETVRGTVGTAYFLRSCNVGSLFTNGEREWRMSAEDLAEEIHFLLSSAQKLSLTRKLFFVDIYMYNLNIGKSLFKPSHNS